jgi:CBS domain-containing protein
MVVRDVVETIKFEVPTVSVSASLRDAVHLMNERNIGAVMVVDNKGEVAGIISERDILRHAEKSSLDTPVSKVATPRDRMIFGHLDDDLDKAMAIMDEHHIRHLPVVDSENRVSCLLSIRDLLRVHMEDVEYDRKALMGYITGSYPYIATY